MVVPSPWPAVQHWQYLAEQEQDHKNEIAGRLRQLERICEGLPQDAIDGDWTVQGIRGYAKRLEDQLKAALAQVEALRAELQSQRERNTELIFKLGSATNGWGRCEKERDAALARVAEFEAQAQHSGPAYVSYTTQPAESLAGIALRQLKDESRWVEIRDINAHAFPDMRSHSYYPAGTVIKLPAAAPGKEVPQAWLDVQAERRRQVEVEGYHGFRDNHYISYELSKAARAYIEVSWHALSGGLPCKKPESWPWMAGFKWSDGRTMLVKACALALAEIERLDRATATQGGPRDA